MTQIFDDGFDDLLIKDPYENIPAEMREEKRWLVYRLEPGVANKKNKIPYHPSGYRCNDSTRGVTFEEAKAASKDYSGLGFYVDAPYLVIDVDACVDPQTGLVSQYAADIIREVNSFSELSPSGTGVHIWCKATKPGTACRKGIEIYDSRRFMTCTGIVIPGVPNRVENRDIFSLYSRMLAGEFQNSEAKIESSIPSDLKISEIESSGGVVTTKLQLLMTGEVSSEKPFVVVDAHGNSITYPSHSEADGALTVLLAFKHEGDAQKIDADFRVSCLYRQKWDRQDYRDQTIKSAIAFYKKSKDAEKPAQVAQVLTGEDEEEIVVLEEKLPDFPQFTGSLGDLCDALSPDIPYPFKFMTAVTHMGLIRSGLDTLAAEPHIQPRMYVALLAQPGRGKTAAINEISKIMKTLTNNYKVFSSIDSGPALVDAFNEQVTQGILKADVNDNLSDCATAKILLSPDEIRGIFEKAKITAGSRNSMLDEILKLYEGNNTGNRARGAKTKINIENAHLGIVGGATESSYAAMWTGTGGASDGLQSRIVPVGIEDRKMPSMQRPPDAEKLTATIQRLVEQVKQPAARFTISEDAFELYDSWWRLKDQTKPSETRIDGIVKRLLIVLARTNDVQIIDVDMMRSAISFGDYIIFCRDKYNPLDAQTWSQMFENLIIVTFQKHGNLSANNCRRLVRPERRPGGVGPFSIAFRNLCTAGMLREVATTQRSKIYRLAL